MDISDPLPVFLPDLYHSSRRLLALIVHTNGTVSKACDKYVSFNLIRSQGGDARPGSRGDILGESVAKHGRIAFEITYADADFCACIPDTDNLDITSH